MPETFLFDFSAQFLISFLFVFAVVFGVIDLSGIFKKNRIVTAVIALSMAAFATGYVPFMNILWDLLPKLVWFFIAIFIVAFVIKIFRVKNGTDPGTSLLFTGIILMILLTAGFYILEKTPKISIPVVGSGDNLFFLVGFIAFLLLLWFTYKLNQSPKENLYQQEIAKRKGQ